jgi:hypothetical protein
VAGVARRCRGITLACRADRPQRRPGGRAIAGFVVVQLGLVVLPVLLAVLLATLFVVQPTRCAVVAFRVHPRCCS